MEAVPGIPTTEMLRQAALHASWRRDHLVGQRKTATRWVAWWLTRWALPVVAALSLGYVPARLADPGDVAALGPAPPPESAALKLSRTLGTPAAPAATPAGSAPPSR